MLASSHTSNSLMQEIWLSLINHNLLIFRLPAPCCKFLCSLAPFSTLSKTVTSGLQDSHQRNLSIFRPLFFLQSTVSSPGSTVVQFSSVQWLSCVQLFATPWTAVSQDSLSITNSQGLTQTHIHWVGDAIQPSYPLSSPSPLAHNLSQHQEIFKWVSSSHQVVQVLELQLQHQSFQWIFRTDFL